MQGLGIEIWPLSAPGRNQAIDLVLHNRSPYLS
jgi:hypothetical protein